MTAFKKAVNLLLISILLVSFSITQSGCGLLLLGGATGAYIYGRQLENCPKCGKLINKNAEVCSNCGKSFSKTAIKYDPEKNMNTSTSKSKYKSKHK